MLITVSQLSPGFVNIRTSKNKRGRTIDWNLRVEFSTASWLADRLDEAHGTPYHAGGEWRLNLRQYRILKLRQVPMGFEGRVCKYMCTASSSMSVHCPMTDQGMAMGFSVVPSGR